MQSKGAISVSHYTLSIEDIKYIFDYLNDTALSSAVSYRDRLFFAVGLATSLRTTALRMLTMDQLREETVRGTACIVFRSLVGGKEGQSKTETGGWKGAGDRARIFPTPDEILRDGRVNFYSIIKEYIGVRNRIDTDSKQFFLSVKTNGHDLRPGNPHKYFTKQSLGKNTFRVIVKPVCMKLGIRGDGACCGITQLTSLSIMNLVQRASHLCLRVRHY